MANLTWPAGNAFRPAPGSGIGITVPKSRFAGFYTGQTTSLSHSAERLVITMVLPPCAASEADDREAFFMGAISEGDRVLMSHPVRFEPKGTMRGSPTVRTDRSRQTETLTIQTTAGATIVRGDVLGVAGQLLMVRSGDTADDAGQASVQLVTRLHAPVPAGTAIVWDRPVAPFEFRDTSLSMTYGRGQWQRQLEVMLYEVRG